MNNFKQHLIEKDTTKAQLERMMKVAVKLEKQFKKIGSEIDKIFNTPNLEKELPRIADRALEGFESANNGRDAMDNLQRDIQDQIGSMGLK